MTYDPASANPDRFRFACDVADHDGCRRARDAGKVMMLREPEAMVTPSLGVLREIGRIAKRERGVAAVNDRREIEYGEARHGTD